MQQQQTPTTDVPPLPTELGSSQSKLVYLYLTASGTATVEELERALSMKKLSILTVLRSLATDGHVTRTGDRYTTSR